MESGQKTYTGGIVRENNYVHFFFFFSFSDHYLGSHRVFQKNESVIQLHLQKKRDTPGTLSRKVRLS